MGFVGGASVANLANTETGGASSVVASVTSALGYGLGVAGRGVVDLYATAFSPLSLFSDGSQGVWYDDSLTSSMFQDSAGTTAAALEQPVGLQLDLSQGLALGSELVTNGTFTTDVNGWFANATNSTIAWDAGTLKLTRTSTGKATAYTTLSGLTVGTRYTVQGSVTAFSGSMGLLYFSTSTSSTDPLVGYTTSSITVAAESKNFYFVASATTMYLHLVIDNNGPGGTANIDNVSVKSIAGNARFQATSANRPTLSARYNQLIKTELLTDAAWRTSVMSVTANATDPLGGTTAFTATATANGGTLYPQVSGTFTGSYRASIYIRRRTGTGTVTLTSANGVTGLNITASLTSSWAVFSATDTAVGGGGTILYGPQISLGTSGDAVDVWHPDCRPVDQATGLIPTYQRVDTSSVYDTVGFPQYIRYDGLNSSLSTASINFTATSKMAVFSGARKLAAVSQVLLEHSISATAVAGGFNLASTAGNYTYTIGSNGGANGFLSSVTYAEPITNVIFVAYDNATSSNPNAISPRINTATPTVGSSTTIATALGQFTNNILYFGRRAGTSLPFNGYEFQTIIVGKTLTATEISNTETYVNSKTLAY
jgi:hypothetical protein